MHTQPSSRNSTNNCCNSMAPTLLISSSRCWQPTTSQKQATKPNSSTNAQTERYWAKSLNARNAEAADLNSTRPHPPTNVLVTWTMTSTVTAIKPSQWPKYNARSGLMSDHLYIITHINVDENAFLHHNPSPHFPTH